ncbi:MAG: hypothetical protein DME57_02245 [Verrucomicrobia bacterium]|nr:MAG: hypothetical protein DME57_02245 [Verrucomicrobiota bacterium]
MPRSGFWELVTDSQRARARVDFLIRNGREKQSDSLDETKCGSTNTSSKETEPSEGLLEAKDTGSALEKARKLQAALEKAGCAGRVKIDISR